MNRLAVQLHRIVVHSHWNAVGVYPGMGFTLACMAEANPGSDACGDVPHGTH